MFFYLWKKHNNPAVIVGHVNTDTHNTSHIDYIQGVNSFNLPNLINISTRSGTTTDHITTNIIWKMNAAVYDEAISGHRPNFVCIIDVSRKKCDVFIKY